ncbi:hypothetical protein [Vibrio albus]|uniref:hypothetical protein n=1 Tax=Vibrio albus TaxID=2200953 RepID=UPI0011B21A47|nr:hypothetical protein [Vibrio albus]
MIYRFLTFGVFAAVLAVIAVMGYQVKSLSDKNDDLTTRLAQSKLQSTMQANIINQFSADREYMDQLLTERAIRSAKEKSKLNETIKNLKDDIRNIQCTIPQSITDQLREPY